MPLLILLLLHVQVLEDTLYQHHYALRDKGLVGQERHLHDPLDSRQPLELIDIEQILEQPILNWINDLQQSVCSCSHCKSHHMVLVII